MSKAKVRWLDLRKLCASYLHAVRSAMGGQRVELGEIDYFSALATPMTSRDPEAAQKQANYLSALRDSGVRLTLSRFKLKDVICPNCGDRFQRPEEKETDVAIAMKLMEVAARGECDVMVLISGDTDLVPAIKAAKRLSPSIMIGVAFPFLRHNAELKGVADFTFAIGQRDVQHAQFPPVVMLPDGTTVLKPAGW